MEPDARACVSCGAALPGQAKFCGHCGEPQPAGDSEPDGNPPSGAGLGNEPASPPQLEGPVGSTRTPAASEPEIRPSPRALSPRILAIAAGAAVVLALGWFLLTSLFGTSGGASDVTLAFEAEGAYGDLYVVDRVEDAEDLARDDRVLRDVTVGGAVRVVDGDRVLTYGPFNYEHDGGPLFAYQEDGDDEWVVAVLDGREVVEIERLDGTPTILVTASGTYVTEQGSGYCSILRLNGRSAERVARADGCAVNGSADVAVLADKRSSEIELSMMDLRSEEETELSRFGDVDGLTVSFSPDNRTMMLSGGVTDGDPETVVVDLGSGEVIAEEDVVGWWATNGGFFGLEYGGSASLVSTLLYHLNNGEVQDVVTGEGVNVFVDPAGSMAAIQESEGGDTILSMARIDGGGVGTLVEIEEFRGALSTEFIGNGRLLVVDDDGLVGVADGQGLLEIGDLRGRGEFATPSIAPAAVDAWLVSAGESVGVVTQSSDPIFFEIEDLETAQYAVGSSDGRWLAAVGSENASSSGISLVLVDLRSGESSVVDEDDGITNIQFSGDRLYFAAVSNGDEEVRRIPLALGERPEGIASGVRLFVPGEATPSSRVSWDQPYWFLG